MIVLQMSMHYQTLKDYGQSMTVNGVPMDQDIVVALVGIEFPPQVTCF